MRCTLRFVTTLLCRVIVTVICGVGLPAATAGEVQQAPAAESAWLACGGRLFDGPVDLRVDGYTVIINESFVWRPEFHVLDPKALIASGQYQPHDVFLDAANSMASTARGDRHRSSSTLKDLQLLVNERLARIKAAPVVLSFDCNGDCLIVEDPATHESINYGIEPAHSAEEQQAAFRTNLASEAKYIQESLSGGVSIAWGNYYCERFTGERARKVRAVLEAASSGALQIDQARPMDRFVTSDFSGERILNAIVLDITAPK